MRTVEIPDAVYEEAARRAAAHDRSLEAIVLEALTTYLDEAPLVLTPEQLEMIAEAEADIDAGNYYTPEEMRERFAECKAAWTRSTLRLPSSADLP